jgi:transcriptional regulator with XRE-family HTH domain
MSSALTAWYRRLMALAEINGDRTQQDVAHALGVSKSAVTSWKEGTRPNPEQVKAAAAAYDADPLELMRIAYLSDEEEPLAARRRSHAGENLRKSPIEPRRPL